MYNKEKSNHVFINSQFFNALLYNRTPVISKLFTKIFLNV